MNRDEKQDQKRTVMGVADWKQVDPNSTYDLPADLLEQALRRLGIMAFVGGTYFLVAIVTSILLQFTRYRIELVGVTIFIRAVGVLAGYSMFFVVRYTRLNRQLKCDLGLVFEVIGAAVLGSTEMITLKELDVPIGIVSMVSIWILLFRLVIPANPTKAFLAAFLSAATIPLSVYLVEQAGHPELHRFVRQGLYKTAFIFAFIAWLASRSIYQMGRAVSEARSMGAYRLEELLGKGGMGEVWLARHALLKRPAAVKLIRAERLGDSSTTGHNATLQRFEREALATAKLNSMHTVKLYDFGSTEDRTFYYVMEYLEGMDLETLVDRFGPLEQARVIFMLKQVCHSLMDAHDNGMIHRDIKPANIFNCQMGPDYDFVKVLDFGLVKPLDQDTPDEAKLTMDGTLQGTPAFMAPEMALGENALTPRVDVYQVGCLGYWMLTGQLVFDGDTLMSVLSQHLQREPVPVSQRTEMPIAEELEGIIMDCLKKEPEQRPTDARELFVRLEAIPSKTSWTNDSARVWWKTHYVAAVQGTVP